MIAFRLFYFSAFLIVSLIGMNKTVLAYTFKSDFDARETNGITLLNLTLIDTTPHQKWLYFLYRYPGPGPDNENAF